jgi:S-adenosylmethionine synthetase
MTAAYGHFGRREPGFTWEMTNKADAIRQAIGLSPGGLNTEVLEKTSSRR